MGQPHHPDDWIRSLPRPTEADLIHELRECYAMIESLLADCPMLAVKLAGSTTVGNRRATLRALLIRAQSPLFREVAPKD